MAKLAEKHVRMYNASGNSFAGGTCITPRESINNICVQFLGLEKILDGATRRLSKIRRFSRRASRVSRISLRYSCEGSGFYGTGFNRGERHA